MKESLPSALFVGPPGQPQVTSHRLSIPEQERILVVYGAYHIHRAGLGRNHEAIAVLQWHIRQTVDSRRILRNIQHHAAGGAYGAESGDQAPGSGGRRRVNVADAGGGGNGGPVNLQFQVLQVVIQTQLLQDAGRLAGKIRSKQVGIWSKASGTGH